MRPVTRLIPLVASSAIIATSILLAPGNAGRASAATVGQVVNVIQTSSWSPASPDPTGIAFVGTGASARLLVVDSEVDEMSIFAGKSMWRATTTGTVETSWNLAGWNKEPTGIAVNQGNGHYFIARDTNQRITEIDLGPDNTYGTADDVRNSWFTDAYALDPEGLTFGAGKLWIGDGAGKKIVTVSPGTDGKFGTPDDGITSFSTLPLGITDPEGVDYVAQTDTLFIIGNQDDADVVETTTTGQLLRTIDLNAVPLVAPSALEIGPSSANPAVLNLYITDRGVDNNVNPAENDGRIYEVALSEAPPQTNLIENGGFELDANGDTRPDSWTANAAFSRSNAAVHSGSFAGRHQSAADVSYSVRQTLSGITPGSSYDFNGWVNVLPTTDPSFKFVLRLQWRNSSGSIISKVNLRTFKAATSGWREVDTTLVAPAGAVSARFLMAVTSLNGTVYVDGFSMTRTP